MSSPLNPVDWRILVEQHAAPTKEQVDRLARDSHGYHALSGARLRSAMAGSDGVLAGGIALCGSATVRDFVHGCHPHLPRVVDELRAQDRLGAPIVGWMLNFALMSECLGVARPAGFDAELLKPLLRAREEAGDTQRRSLAFTALALGDTTSALSFIDEPPGSYDSPLLRVEFNQLELLRYLAAALDARRPADWIEPLWVEYFELFPVHLAAQAAEWPDLFNFARVLAGVRGENVASIADDIHARVMHAARPKA